MTYLSGLIHRRRTDPRLGEWLQALRDSPLAADPHSDAGTTIRQLRRDYEKRVKLPQSLVEELTRATVLGQQAWTEARANNDFAAFQPHLARIYELKRATGRGAGLSRRAVRRPAGRLRAGGQDGRDRRACWPACGTNWRRWWPRSAPAGGRRRSRSCAGAIPWRPRRRSARAAAAAIGFDFQRGRLDVTHHPFCAGMGPSDCRITTRYDEQFFCRRRSSASCTRRATACTSRACGPSSTDCRRAGSCRWASTNRNRGCGRTWSAAAGPSGSTSFRRRSGSSPTALGDVTLDEFYFAINDVRPSLIRVEADEATYNLHILIRFELERALLRRRSAGRPNCRPPGTRSTARTWASSRRTTRTACCRTSTGAPG